jgi:rhamnosyltransferase
MNKSIDIKEITGVVVLYNPEKENLEQLIETASIFKELIIVNNSPENQSIKDFIISDKYPKNIIYFENPENLGIAQPLNKGAEIAIKKGYKWLTTLDQDSVFKKHLFKNMIDQVSGTNLEKVGIISPLVNNNGFQDLNNHQEIETIEYCITSGNVISLEVWKKVGGFEESYFIYHVDNQYNLKLKIHGFKILRLNNIVLVHQMGGLESFNILGKKIIWNEHAPIAFYYMTRNSIFYSMELLKNHEYRNFFNTLNGFLVKENFKAIFFQKNKLKQLKFIIWGYFDALRNKRGKL